ncbi:hypothetical protein K443DRAFT_207017 [Laccaria amethystina LaAM-08-1]|uniref:Uncharacterized protein n=1 Tax=Laccaria amethystina LaAM-08-1 TaxID=1095629 RepID=A0A0C9XLY1_9AGAR|nr:hypothetical protein K443DRAFT_207017 [Laccaria amethystina LaAM-08-1]
MYLMAHTYHKEFKRFFEFLVRHQCGVSSFVIYQITSCFVQRPYAILSRLLEPPHSKNTMVIHFGAYGHLGRRALTLWP